MLRFWWLFVPKATRKTTKLQIFTLFAHKFNWKTFLFWGHWHAIVRVGVACGQRHRLRPVPQSHWSNFSCECQNRRHRLHLPHTMYPCTLPLQTKPYLLLVADATYVAHRLKLDSWPANYQYDLKFFARNLLWNKLKVQVLTRRGPRTVWSSTRGVQNFASHSARSLASRSLSLSLNSHSSNCIPHCIPSTIPSHSADPLHSMLYFAFALYAPPHNH